MIKYITTTKPKDKKAYANFNSNAKNFNFTSFQKPTKQRATPLSLFISEVI